MSVHQIQTTVVDHLSEPSQSDQMPQARSRSTPKPEAIAWLNQCARVLIEEANNRKWYPATRRASTHSHYINLGIRGVRLRLRLSDHFVRRGHVSINVIYCDRDPHLCAEEAIQKAERLFLECVWKQREGAIELIDERPDLPVPYAVGLLLESDTQQPIRIVALCTTIERATSLCSKFERIAAISHSSCCRGSSRYVVVRWRKDHWRPIR